MAANTRFAYVGPAHVLAGAFTADGSGLVPLGELATVSIPLSGGNKAMVRTGSGHPSAVGGIDYGRLAGLNMELDTVTKEMIAELISAANVDVDGNLTLATTASAIVPISAVVVPSRNINPATGAVTDLTDVFWLPFLTDDGEITQTHNNSRGQTANTPLSVQLQGLVGDEYGADTLPLNLRNYLHGDPSDFDLDWRLPVPYQAALP